MLNRENSDGSGYLHEKQGTSSSLQILHPSAFCFKEERVLAVHPPSCHPRRVFGCLESVKKMREKGVKEEKWETGKKRAESFCGQNLLIDFSVCTD